MSTTPKRYVLVDAGYRVCPNQRKRAENTIDYRHALNHKTRAFGSSAFGRITRTALAANSINDLITLTRHDPKLSWPLSVYEVSGDRDTDAAHESRLRRLHGITVHREIPVAELLGPHGVDVVDVIEKIYRADRYELTGRFHTKRDNIFTNIVIEHRSEHVRAKVNLRNGAEAAGIVDEMYLANQLASHAAGLSTNFFDTLTGFPLTDIGCSAAATAVRGHISDADYTTLTAPLTSRLGSMRRR